jgi:hypothetical protein
MPLTIWTATLAANNDRSDESAGFLVRKAFAMIARNAFRAAGYGTGEARSFGCGLTLRTYCNCRSISHCLWKVDNCRMSSQPDGDPMGYQRIPSGVGSYVTAKRLARGAHWG